MSPETAVRLAAVESASLRPDARMITTMSLAFEGFFEEMGCPFTPEQRAAIDHARSEIARGYASWCDCAEKLIPVGALSIWDAGKLHSPDVCLVTDDVSALSMAAAS